MPISCPAIAASQVSVSQEMLSRVRPAGSEKITWRLVKIESAPERCNEGCGEHVMYTMLEHDILIQKAYRYSSHAAAYQRSELQSNR
jgi:hypothetical protein